MTKNYRMRINGTCIIEGCDQRATRVLNVRMRRRDTGAEFGPNLDPAVFCSEHADNGADVEITFRPNRTGVVRFSIDAGGAPVSYTHRMRDGHPGQEALL